jgi:hypothetical protein
VISRQVCPFHSDEDVLGSPLGNDGSYVFVCELRRGHPAPGPYSWVQSPEPPDQAGIGGLAEELRLDLELPAALGAYRGRWVEYGVLEATYAARNPSDFAQLVGRYGHTAIKPTRYSASAFLAFTLGRLSLDGSILFHIGPATGRWSYNGQIFWWALPPAPPWTERVSWGELARSMNYVPGNTE